MDTTKLVHRITRETARNLSPDAYDMGMPVVVEGEGLSFEPWVEVRRTGSGPVMVLVPRYGEEPDEGMAA